jgi:hypothetical protein
MTDQENMDNATKLLKRSKEQYDYMTKGLNNPDLVKSILNGHSAYTKKLKQVRAASAGLFVFSMGLEIAFMFIKTEDPVLAAIKDLSDKIDELADDVARGFEHLEKVLDEKLYIQDRNKIDTEFEHLKSAFQNIPDRPVNPDLSVVYKEFFSAKNLGQTNNLMVSIRLLITRSDQSVASILGATHGNISRLNEECTYLLAVYCQVQSMRLMIRREIAYMHRLKLSGDDLIEYDSIYEGEVKQLIEVYETNFDKMAEKIGALHEECVDEMPSHCRKFIKQKRLFNKPSVSKLFVDNLNEELHENFPLHDFFSTAYTGVGGKKAHSIVPIDHAHQIKNLRVTNGSDKVNIVVHWWPSISVPNNDREPYIKILIPLPSMFAPHSQDHDKPLLVGMKIDELDKDVNRILFFDKKASSLSRAVAMHDCGSVNGKTSPSETSGHDETGYYGYKFNSKNKICFAATRNISVHKINFYVQKKSYTNVTSGERRSGVILHAVPKEKVEIK